MGPQEHAFRSGVDVIVATPGRLLDHFRHAYAQLDGLEVLVARRGRPHARHGIPARHPPGPQAPPRAPPDPLLLARRCRRRSRRWRARSCGTPRRSTSSASPRRRWGSRQAVYPVRRNLKPPLLAELLRRGDIQNVLVFTRTKHRANRLAEALSKEGRFVRADPRQPQPAQRTAGARGLQERPVPRARRDRHRGARNRRRGSRARRELRRAPRAGRLHPSRRPDRPRRATGDAFTFVSPEEESDLRAIERALGGGSRGSRFPDSTTPRAPAERLEIPIAERIAAIRARKAEDRERAKAKAGRRSAAASAPPRRGGPVSSGRPPGPSGSPGGGTSWSSPRSRRRPGRGPSARTRPGRP